MITEIAAFGAEAIKFASVVETNLNRPDMIADAIKRLRQKHRDAVDAAQNVLQDPKASQIEKDAAFAFIQRTES